MYSHNYGMVYSSDMTSTSCYSMEPIKTPIPITMTTLTSIVSISPIYGTSSVTFANETQACTIVDLN